MSDRWTDRLSEYLDGELSERERSALDRHLESCAECRTVLAELREVVAVARARPPAEPATDLWPAIAARLGPQDRSQPRVLELSSRRPRVVAFTVPQLIAAALALVVLSAGTFWAIAGSGDPGGADAPLAADAPPAEPTSFALAGFENYDRAIDQLERDLELRRTALDTATVRVVEENLRIIDGAIAEAMRALEADPSSTYLNAYAASALQRKVDLLRQATTLAVNEI